MVVSSSSSIPKSDANALWIPFPSISTSLGQPKESKSFPLSIYVSTSHININIKFMVSRVFKISEGLGVFMIRALGLQIGEGLRVFKIRAPGLRVGEGAPLLGRGARATTPAAAAVAAGPEAVRRFRER